MRIEVKVPQLPESVAEATLVNWHKKAGEAVKRDENLIDIETDKVVLELPAPGDGVIVEITRPDGSTVTSNDVIAVIDTDGKADGAARSTAAVAPTAAPAASAAPAAAPPAAPAAAPPAASATALPAARKMMADQGVDPSTVTGTGRGGRILKEDVAQTVAARAKPAATPAAPPAAAKPPAPKPPSASLGARPEQHAIGPPRIGHHRGEGIGHLVPPRCVSNQSRYRCRRSRR